MSHNEYIRRERAREAAAVAKRALGAAHRAAAVLASEDRTVDAAIGVDGAARALDTYFGALDARADLVRTVGDTAARAVKSATAARMTREVRDDSAAACRWADHKSVTGALHTSKMRVRRQGGGAPSDVCGPRMATPGVGAEHTIAARGVACATLRDKVRAFYTCKGREQKRALRAHITTILTAWDGDVEVRACAQELGWRSV